jgi:hypothetical protein
LKAIRRFRGHRARSYRFVFSSALFLALAVALGVAPALADSPPTATIEPATSVSYQSAVLHGTVDPNGGPSDTTWQFELTSDGGVYWNFSDHPFQNAGHGSGPVSVEDTVHYLQPGTTYMVRLAASNEGGGTTSPEPYEEFTTKDTTPPVVSIDAPTAITGTTAHFTGTINPGGSDPAFAVNWQFECTPACPGAGSGYIEADTSDHTVEGDPVGLEPNTHYEVRLVASNAGESAATGSEAFATGTMAPSAKTISAYALDGGTTALLGGLVDPQNSPTTYWFEYGPDANYGKAIPAGEDGDAGAGGAAVIVTREVGGLTPGQTYHYRLAAHNDQGTVFGGDMAFEAQAPAADPVSCPNDAFREGKAARLPDCRGLEMVSPPDKNNADAYVANAMASAAGDKIAWVSQGSFAGAGTAKGVNLGNYMSSRGSGSWSTEFFSPERGLLHFQNGFSGFTEDLSKGFLANREKPGRSLDPGIDEEGFNFYLRDNLTKTYTLLNGLTATGYSGFGWASADMSKISFESNQVLTPDAPCDGFSNTVCAYEWDNGELRLASILPNGDPAVGSVAQSGVGWPNNNIENDVSDDGHRLFWVGGEFLSSEIYVREDGISTRRVAESERTLPGGMEEGSTEYLGAEAAHGSRVLLKTNRSLVDEDTDSNWDLYVADLDAPAGQRMTLISADENEEAPEGAGALGFVSRSSDMRRVYFVTENQIVPGEPSPAGPKLFLWDDTGASPAVRYMGNLAPSIPDPYDAGDERLWQPATIGLNNADKPARISPNGRYMTFRSKAQLTAFDNDGAYEIYLYDADSGQMRCGSCSEDAYPAAGYVGYDSSIDNTSPVVTHQLRNVNDRGQVFFETSRGLLSRDSNGKIDVYEYGGGDLNLISLGTGGEDSRFLDAGKSGDDVFFRTTDRLVGWDTDQNADVYDARVNGGYPEPPPQPAPCEGDACQPPPVAPNDATPASSGFKGPESPAPRFKKKKHHKRRHHKKRHHRRRHQQGKKKQTSTRKHG